MLNFIIFKYWQLNYKVESKEEKKVSQLPHRRSQKDWNVLRVCRGSRGPLGRVTAVMTLIFPQQWYLEWY